MVCKANSCASLAFELISNGLRVFDPAVAQAQVDRPKAAAPLHPQRVLPAGRQLRQEAKHGLPTQARAKLMGCMQLLQDPGGLRDGKVAQGAQGLAREVVALQLEADGAVAEPKPWPATQKRG